MSRLEARALARQTPAGALIEDVSFTVEDGRIAALYGVAGSGVVASLRVVAGLDRHDAGDVLLGERTLSPIPPHRRGIGMVTGDPALFPRLDVRGNVAFGLRMRGWPRADRDARVDALLREFGLFDAARARVDALSDADRLRVALARALAPQPALLLLENPLAGIDDSRRDAMRDELRRRLRAAEITTLIATHELRDATTIADDIVVMDEGRVLQSGPLARVLAGPSSVRVAVMVGYAVLVHGEVHGGFVLEERAGAVRIPDGFPLEHAAVVLAHPSTLLAVPAGSNLGCGVSGEVRRVRPHGPMHLLDVQLDDRTIEVRWEWDLRPPAVGTRVEIAARPGTLRFFNAPWPPAPPPLAEPSDDEAREEPETEDEEAAEEEEPVAEAAVAASRDGDEPEDEPEDEPDDEDDEDRAPASAVPPPRRRVDAASARSEPRHPEMPAFE